MKSLLADPIVLICSGIILVCFFGLIWAIGKLRRLKTAVSETGGVAETKPFFRGLDLGIPPIPRMGESPATPPLSRDVMERLDGMTQRLTEMQSVLMKQPGVDPAASGGMGQGFSPETIEKLLKIVGNVMQQVDVLQKSLGPKDGPPKV